MVSGASAPEPGTVKSIQAARAEVLLLDDAGTGRPDAGKIRELRKAMPALRVVLINMPEEERAFLDSVRAGAMGYVLRDASAMDVVAAVRAVMQSEAVAPARLTQALFQYVARQTSHMPSARLRMELGLTRREQQLVPLIAEGKTNKEIAAQLNLSEQTIKNHIHRMLQRVGASGRLEVVELVRVQGAYLD